MRIFFPTTASNFTKADKRQKRRKLSKPNLPIKKNIYPVINKNIFPPNLKIYNMKLNKKIAISESGFIFDPTTGDSFTVNPIATEILNFLHEGKSIKQIKQEMLKMYDVAEHVLDKSVDEFIEVLINLRILEND